MCSNLPVFIVVVFNLNLIYNVASLLRFQFFSSASLLSAYSHSLNENHILIDRHCTASLQSQFYFHPLSAQNPLCLQIFAFSVLGINICLVNVQPSRVCVLEINLQMSSLSVLGLQEIVHWTYI